MDVSWEALLNNLCQRAWIALTGLMAVAVFLVTFVAVGAISDSTPPSATPAARQAVAPPDRSASDFTAARSVQPVVPSSAGATETDNVAAPLDATPSEETIAVPPTLESDAATPDISIPAFAEEDLIFGGDGREGAILAGSGIVPSSGIDRGTSWEIIVPSAQIRSSLVRVGIAATGALGAPDNPFVVGWWENGAAPGESGNVLLAGHRDYRDIDGNLGTGVAWLLPETQLDDVVIVKSPADGVAFVYSVVEVVSVPWNSPDGVAYLEPTANARLTLITCEGSFDTERSSYQRRRIVVADMVGQISLDALAAAELSG